MGSHADWLSLVQLDGLVISEPVLDEYFPGGMPAVSKGMHNWFRRQAERYRVAQGHADLGKRSAGARQWIDFLLDHVLELPGDAWLKAGDVPGNARVFLPEFEQELRPDRVLVHKDKPVLLVSIVDPEQSLDRRDRTPGRWKASPSTKLERLLRDTGHPLGLLTNGEDFRLIYAHAGLNTGHISWTSRMLVEEKATLDAFCALLSRELLLPTSEEANSLADLCRISQDRQGEVADQLGEQVRNGLERLIWAWDAADRECGGELLKAESEDRIYETGLVVMMRLVFLLYAEERDLLPHGEVLYDQGYGLTFLWHQLQRQAQEDEARLDDTFDAWDRFLATCRMVHGGCGHPDLSLLAYGGRLFDPKRFPALEDPRCRVSNRTVFDVLRLLLFARQRKGGEPQRVGYWAIDVEQIGYIYEGLLDHRCARAGDVPLVKFRGGGEAAFPLDEIEKMSRDALVKKVVEVTGRKEDGVRDALDQPASVRGLNALRHFPSEVVERVQAYAGIIQCEEVVPPRWRYLTTGTSRRASGAHYTPQSLTERIVRVTLEPLVYKNVDGKPGLLVEPKQVKTARELLDLKVCDIAMGSGAFLVQAVRYLGDRVVEAWDRALAHASMLSTRPVLTMPFAEPTTDAEADRPIDAEHRDEIVMWARRYVVERSIYGVDINPLAVEMAKLSLWLTTLAKDRSFTFLDHSLRCGDSLVGLDMEQLLTWSLDREGTGDEILEHIVRKAVDETLRARQELLCIAAADAEGIERKRALLLRAEAAMEKVRLAADLIVAPYFAEAKDKAQEGLRDQLQAAFCAGQKSASECALLARRSREMLGGQQTFHWPLEFPEVFLRSDAAGFNSEIGNPPFFWGNRISTFFGSRYAVWLRRLHEGATGNADLAAHFLRRCATLGQPRATIGLVTTNSISESDTMTTGLSRVLSDGATLFAAERDMTWPGQDASVHIALLWLFLGPWAGMKELDGKPADKIGPDLREPLSSWQAEKLVSNTRRSFKGVDFGGDGFIVSSEEREAIILRSPRERSVLSPLLNADDLMSSVGQRPLRFIINFTGKNLAQAREAPACLQLVEERVKPGRDKKSGKEKTEWWTYRRAGGAYIGATRGLVRVLINPVVAKHHAFAFSEPNIVFANTVNIFAFDDAGTFGLLQSTIHEAWSRHHRSTLETRTRYNPTRCFETFPFPELCALSVGVRDIACEYYDGRFRFTVEQRIGLTQFYNAFHDPNCGESGVLKLRDLHSELDNAVRDAYGWRDLDLEHGWFKTVTPEEKKDKKTGKVRVVEHVEWRFTISERARQEVLRRLLELNHKLYAEEVAAGLHDKKSKRRDDEESEGVNEDAGEPEPTGEGPAQRSFNF